MPDYFIKNIPKHDFLGCGFALCFIWISNKKLDYIRKLNKNYVYKFMEVGKKKNFKNAVMDFSNISPFVNGHPLEYNKLINRWALVDNFSRPSTLLL